MTNVIPLFDKETMESINIDVMNNALNRFLKTKKYIITIINEDGYASTLTGSTEEDPLRQDDLAFMQKMMNRYIDSMYP